ncbi:MAG: hypothetical protein FJX77_00835 [Armatimonadetes bacterium]|nr:hypothetical protein [Armatimonadota bacterium]
MRVLAETEIVTIHGRSLNLKWRLARHGEWLAWCYVPAASLLHHEGVGFEARAGSPDEAKAEVRKKVEEYLSRTG